MTRLIDLFYNGIEHYFGSDIPRPVESSMRTLCGGDCEIVVIDNVAKYIFSREDKNYREFTIKDFPNVAPIFSSTWFEWRYPLRLNDGDRGLVLVPENKGIFGGVHIVSEKDQDVWRCQAFFYAGEADFTCLMGWTSYSVDHYGVLIQCGDVSLTLSAEKEIRECYSPRNDTELSFFFVAQFLFPALLATSFIHCKNVEVSTIVPARPLSKRHKRKTGRPLIKYRVIDIKPMQSILRTEGSSDTLGIRHALHICRGHFKDYSHGGGLFGRNKGLYWWEAHVRGDPDQGVVVKDYNVNPPGDNFPS